MTTQDLLNLKKEIEKAKSEVSELEGKRKVLLETLKTEFDCKFEDIEKVKKDLENKVGKLEKEKDKIIKQLEEEYEF